MPALNTYFVGEQDLSFTTQWTSSMITASSGTVLSARSSRTGATIINNSTGTLLVLEGGGAALGNYSGILAKCTTANDGTGGSYVVSSYPGVMSVNGASCVVIEHYRKWS